MITPPAIAIFISTVVMTGIYLATRDRSPETRRNAGLFGLLGCGIFSFLIVAGWFVGLIR